MIDLFFNNGFLIVCNAFTEAARRVHRGRYGRKRALKAAARAALARGPFQKASATVDKFEKVRERAETFFEV
jgi:hypothetical protein